MDKVKYKEDDIFNIIKIRKYVEYADILHMLSCKGLLIDELEIKRVIQKLIGKKYIYQITSDRSYGRNHTYTSAYYYNDFSTRKFNNEVIRASLYNSRIYYNETDDIKVISITIETEAPLKEENFKNDRIFNYSAKEGINRNYPKYTYKIQCVVEPHKELFLTPNEDYINKITNGLVDKSKFYYSMRITVEEYKELEYTLNSPSKLSLDITLNQTGDFIIDKNNSIGILISYKEQMDSKPSEILETFDISSERDYREFNLNKGKVVCFINPILYNKKLFNGVEAKVTINSLILL